jgi:hypothetical protein
MQTDGRFSNGRYWAKYILLKTSYCSVDLYRNGVYRCCHTMKGGDGLRQMTEIEAIIEQSNGRT